MPDAFLFDIGNVIITFDFAKAARRIAPLARVEADKILLEIAPLTIELEMGRMNPEEFIATASAKIGYSGKPGEFRGAFEDIFELNLPMVTFIENLKEKGTPLYLVSNTNAIHVPFFEFRYPVFRHFDGHVYSHEVGVMKPDAKIYEVVKETFPLEPARTVYIDDLPANCVAGKEAGFLALPYSIDKHDEFLNIVASISGR